MMIGNVQNYQCFSENEYLLILFQPLSLRCTLLVSGFWLKQVFTDTIPTSFTQMYAFSIRILAKTSVYWYYSNLFHSDELF